jgi:hypothetical protein
MRTQSPAERACWLIFFHGCKVEGGKMVPIFFACSWPHTFVVSTKEALTPAALVRRCTNSATKLEPRPSYCRRGVLC